MKSINQTQKIILFIVIAIVLFFVSYPIAVEASNGVVEVYSSRSRSVLRLNDAFAFKHTWYVWAIYSLIVGTIGFLMFRNKSE